MGGGTEFASKDPEAYSNFDTAPETVTLGLEEYNQVSIWQKNNASDSFKFLTFKKLGFGELCEHPDC